MVFLKCVNENTTNVQASQLYNVSTTKMKLVDCTRNYRNVICFMKLDLQSVKFDNQSVLPPSHCDSFFSVVT